MQREKARLLAAFRRHGGDVGSDGGDVGSDGGDAATAESEELTVLRGRHDAQHMQPKPKRGSAAGAELG